MRIVIRFDPASLPVDRVDVRRRLGLPPGQTASGRLEDLLRRAEALLASVAFPAALLDEVSAEEFAAIYYGTGANAPRSPLEDISPRADVLALFTATLGRGVDTVIQDLFGRGDPALGYALDVTSGSTAGRLADLTAERFAGELARDRRRAPQMRALPYSPGYCGWHVSGQRALFDRLGPEEIGIRLTAGSLMNPIKSVSGVLVAAPPPVHRFSPTYPCCASCATRECLKRMASMKEPCA
jgi:hypothetical protein